MKNLFIAACLMLASSFAFAAPSPKNAITPKEAKEVLQAIDNICADTWCEGDYGYHFHELECSTEHNGISCVLKLEMTSSFGLKSDDRQLDISSHRSYPLTCTMNGLSREQILSKDSDGRISYGEGIYEKVDHCISQMEEYIWKTEGKR